MRVVGYVAFAVGAVVLWGVFVAIFVLVVQVF